jgi:hypothetical protein
VYKRRIFLHYSWRNYLFNLKREENKISQQWITLYSRFRYIGLMKNREFSRFFVPGKEAPWLEIVRNVHNGRIGCTVLIFESSAHF